MVPRIAVVIPAYNESTHIADVLRAIPPDVAHIIVVDDASTDGTAAIVTQMATSRISMIQHEANQGVGGAVCSGYKRALDLRADIVLKIDGDGQMDPSLIPALVAPILRDQADYCKGARFCEWPALRQMPLPRLLGNLGLSFLAKLVSGYWTTFDPSNGFTAIHREVLERLPLDRISRGFFFETDMLIHLYYLQAVVADVQIPARYGNEQSKLSPLEALFSFAGKLPGAFLKRILWRYFLLDFTAFSVFLIVGLLLFVGGVSFGAATWIINGIHGEVTTTGTVMLSVVPLFLGFQLLLQAVVLDITNVPKIPIHSSTSAGRETSSNGRPLEGGGESA